MKNIQEEAYFEYLLDHYQRLVYSICYKTTGNQFDAEDLTQDVFVAAYKKLSEFDRQYEKAWLCKIASRKCLDYLKQAARRTSPTEDTFFEEIPDRNDSSPEQTYLETESKNRVLSICSQLKSPYREVAIAYFYNELTAQEIAQTCDKNLKTVQTQIYRARAMIKKTMERGG